MVRVQWFVVLRRAPALVLGWLVVWVLRLACEESPFRTPSWGLQSWLFEQVVYGLLDVVGLLALLVEENLPPTFYRLG